MALPVLPVRHHASLEAIDGDRLESVSVGPQGEAIALWSTGQDAAALRPTTTQPGWATFPDPRTPLPVAVRVTVYRPEPIAAVAIEALTLAYPRAQTLPDGRVLVAGIRCRWRPDGPERNAVVYDSDGQVLAERTLGDGIEHVMAAADGHVWVGYFDEGVYGSFGWGGPGPTPLGAPGLVRFSPDLEPDWTFPSHSDHPWGAIDDCYALNVDRDTVWACYYSGFPLVRIQAGTVTWWRNTIVSGARAMAVADASVALYGGYGADRDRLVLAVPDASHLHQVAEYRVVMPDGSPMPGDTVVNGRGADLHLFTGGTWYRLNLDNIHPTRPGP